eukprot:UN11702
MAIIIEYQGCVINFELP